MAVGSHTGVREGNGFAIFVFRPDGLGKVFKVHLVADAGAGGHNAEILEGRLAPAQEFIALAIALVFALHILAEALRTAEIIHHDRVVDHEIHRHLGIDG